MDITVFLGAPGSGKGTQAKRLAQSNGFRHFSTGDMLRAALREGTPQGKRAQTYIDRGELVPDEVMIELIETAISQLGPSARVILDGFPRTVPQAEALDSKAHTKVSRAVYFMVPESVLVERLTGRRICEKCGESYHSLFLPPSKTDVCDKCGGRLIQRTDDSESVVRRRLEIFTQQNGQLLNFYGKSKKLREINANKAVETLQSELLDLLQ